MESKYRSIEINLIMGGLAKAQGSYKRLVANEDSPSGKFANLEAILAATRESLSLNNIGFYQHIELLDEGSGAALLWSTIGHDSGQFISSCARVITGKTDRNTGNSMEFHKRLHALLVLGIAPSKNDPLLFDDNGEEQSEQNLIEKLRKPKTDVTSKSQKEDVITNDRYQDLMYELEGFDDIAQGVMDKYNIETLADLPNSEYHRTVAQIRKIKDTHKHFMNKK